MMRTLESVLPAGRSVRDALALLETSPLKLCVVVDDAGRVKRTVTDGDVRRGLLAGLRLDTPVTTLPARAPVTAPEGTDDDALAAIMQRESVTTIVLVDDEGRPSGLRDLTQISGPILLSPPHLGAAESRYVQDAFDSNWIAPAGPNLAAFEAALARVSGRSEAVALATGTAGLHLALRVLELPRGTAVYVSDKTFVASLQPILYEGLSPVLIDAEPVSWNMSPDALERRLRKDAERNALPGAIMLVHLYGQPADLARILPLAERYGVPVIEDAAESLGARHGNRPSGAHGLIAAYSFNGNKIITTSGGGAVVTDDPEIAARIRHLSTQGRDDAEHYQHSTVAYNYRMSNVLAGIGLGQLEVLDDRVRRRRAIHRRYREALGPLPGIGFQEEVADSKGNRWLTVVTFDPDEIPFHPYQIMRLLRARGIETRPSWKPMHMQPLCRGMPFVPHSGTEAVSSELFLRALCLPSGSGITEAQQDRVVGHLTDILERARA